MKTWEKQVIKRFLEGRKKKRAFEGYQVKTVGPVTTVTPTSGKNREPVEIYNQGGRFRMSYQVSKRGNPITGSSSSLNSAIAWARRILTQYRDFEPMPRLSGSSQQILMVLKKRGGKSRIDPAHADLANEVIRKGLVVMRGGALALTSYGEKVVKYNL